MKTRPNNRFSVTIKSENDLKKIDNLIASEDFKSKTEIIDKCIELALPILMNGKIERTESSRPEEIQSILKIVKNQNSKLDDLTVLLTVTLDIVTSLLKERSLVLQGHTTNSEDLENGHYQVLSEHYQNILNELMK